MHAPVMDTKNLVESAHPHFVRFMEGIEMNLSKITAKLNNQVSAILNSNAPAKIMGGIALGGLLMAAVALPSSPAHADDPAKPLVETRLVITDSFWGSFYEQMAEVEGRYPVADSSSREAATISDGFWEPFYEGMSEFTAPENVLCPGPAICSSQVYYDDGRVLMGLIPLSQRCLSISSHTRRTAR